MASGSGTFRNPELFFIDPNAPATPSRSDRRAMRRQISTTWCVKLRQLISDTGKRHWEVAQDIGIPPAQLSHILNRYRTPTPEQLIAIAEYFKVDPAELI